MEINKIERKLLERERIRNYDTNEYVRLAYSFALNMRCT